MIEKQNQENPLIMKIKVQTKRMIFKKTIDIVRALDMSIDKKDYAKRRAYVEKINKL